MPILSKPKVGKILLVYLAVPDKATSVALVQDEGGVQKPVYYVSKALTNAETRYPVADKMAFALLITAAKLRPYFQAHPIAVLTNFPLQGILVKPDLSGRLIKWTV